MKTFDWKDKYTNVRAVDVTSSAKYVSLVGSKRGTFLRNNPGYTNIISDNKDYVFSGGNFDVTVTGTGTTLIGQGMQYTHMGINWIYQSVYPSLNIKELSCTNPRFSNSNITMVSCMITNLGKYTTVSIYNSILKDSVCDSYTLKNNCNTLTLVNCSGSRLLSNLSVYYDCEVEINQSTINECYSYYVGFDSCRFFIGDETQATPLIGDTNEELRQNFVDRCKSQNLVLKEFDEYGQKSILGRWCFSKKSIIGGYNVLENSEIDLFAKRRSIYLGYTNKSFKQIPITTNQGIPGSFAPSNPRSLINVASDSLTINASVDTRNAGYIDSKIIYLGGKHQLTAINIHDNLPIENGVSVDSVYSFGEKTETVEPDINYIVISTNTEQAKIRYNEVEYNSSLIGRDNVFRGIAGVSTFTPLSNNVMVLPVTDLANHQTLRVRLVSDIPSGEIRGTSNLQKDYWYIVVPDNMQDTSGSITYKGIKHPCFDSFVADSTANFTINGACHLRRCWRKDYTESDETIDKNFWQSRQKPLYFDVIPDDLRALRKNNTITENEIMKDSNQQYIGSGHIDFYNSINGANGVKLPAFNLVGTFLQIQIPISTLNPM